MNQLNLVIYSNYMSIKANSSYAFYHVLSILDFELDIEGLKFQVYESTNGIELFHLDHESAYKILYTLSFEFTLIIN